MPAINQGLHDAHPYVRRTAVMGVMKVYNIDSSLVNNTGEHAQDSLGATIPFSRAWMSANVSVNGIIWGASLTLYPSLHVAACNV